MPGIDRIHGSAGNFEAVADAYERGRPDWPEDIVRSLVDLLGIGPDATVVDVGAGTGKLSRMLVPLARRVIAVEPVPAMRQRLAALAPSVEVFDGTAEETGLDAGTADAITASQAFHWFDGPAALAEFARISRPAARLGLVWHMRDEQSGLQAEVTASLEPHRGDVPRARDRLWLEPFGASAWTVPELTTFHHRQSADEETFLDRYLTVSFVAGLASPERSEVERRLRAIFDRHADPSGQVVLDYVTELHISSRRS